MVVLILTRSGFDDMRSQIDTARDAVWVNAGVFSQPEVDHLRSIGWNLTIFTNGLDLSDLASDLEMIRLHHPDQVLWAEAVAR